jgi:hypothetical protein
MAGASDNAEGKHSNAHMDNGEHEYKQEDVHLMLDLVTIESYTINYMMNSIHPVFSQPEPFCRETP